MYASAQYINIISINQQLMCTVSFQAHLISLNVPSGKFYVCRCNRSTARPHAADAGMALSHKRHDFMKKKLLKIKCVFLLSL